MARLRAVSPHALDALLLLLGVLGCGGLAGGGGGLGGAAAAAMREPTLRNRGREESQQAAGACLEEAHMIHATPVAVVVPAVVQRRAPFNITSMPAEITRSVQLASPGQPALW